MLDAKETNQIPDIYDTFLNELWDDLDKLLPVPVDMLRFCGEIHDNDNKIDVLFKFYFSTNNCMNITSNVLIPKEYKIKRDVYDCVMADIYYKLKELWIKTNIKGYEDWKSISISINSNRASKIELNDKFFFGEINEVNKRQIIFGYEKFEIVPEFKSSMDIIRNYLETK